MQRAEAGVGFLARRSGATVLPVAAQHRPAQARPAPPPRDGAALRRTLRARADGPARRRRHRRRDRRAHRRAVTRRHAACTAPAMTTLDPAPAPARPLAARCDLRRGRPALAVVIAALRSRSCSPVRAGSPRGWPRPAARSSWFSLGLASAGHAADAVTGNWNVLLFFAGLMAVAGLADEAGVFVAVTGWRCAWAALADAPPAGGLRRGVRGHRLPLQRRHRPDPHTGGGARRAARGRRPHPVRAGHQLHRRRRLGPSAGCQPGEHPHRRRHPCGAGDVPQRAAAPRRPGRGRHGRRAGADASRPAGAAA